MASLASMRPRFFKRGKKNIVTNRRKRLVTASMRPRFFKRGKLPDANAVARVEV